MKGFERLKAIPDVLLYLGGLPHELAACLTEALRQIRDGRVALIHGQRPGFWIALACDHIILLSTTRDERSAVVVGLFEDDTSGEV